MVSVSLAESAALVLRHLESSGFCKTAGTFRRSVPRLLQCGTSEDLCMLPPVKCCSYTPAAPSTTIGSHFACREARKLLTSIITPPSVKSLDAILNEYVHLKEAEIKKKQIAEANPLVSDLLAAIDRHVTHSARQSSIQPAAEAQCDQQPLQAVDTTTQGARFVGTAGPQLCQQPVTYQAINAAQQHTAAATPSCQKPPLHLPAFACKTTSHSQHRKGAPQRRLEVTDSAPSPVSRETVLAPGNSLIVLATACNDLGDSKTHAVYFAFVCAAHFYALKTPASLCTYFLKHMACLQQDRLPELLSVML